VLSFPPSPQVRIFVCRRPMDMRKSFDGLSGAVIDVIDEDPQSGHLFLFFNKRRSMLKALCWEPSGYWVLSKRLESGQFQIFDRVSERSESFELASHELALLLEGLDLRGARRVRERAAVKALLDA
jgi:transposase